MNWRLPVVVSMVLITFLGFAFFYYKSFVKPRAHGIILFVVNGLDTNLLHRARLSTQLAKSRQTLAQVLPGELKSSTVDEALSKSKIFRLEHFPFLASLNVQGPEDPVADEGALSTALASGLRVPNGLVGCNALNQQLDTLIYAAQRARRATGLITTGSFVSPTPVAFYTYLRHPKEKYRASAALADSAKIDVLLGGGSVYFEPAHITNEAGRSDGRDLIQEMKRQGYAIVRTKDELLQVPPWRTRQLLGLFARGPFASRGDIPYPKEQPSLAEMTQVAIQCLQYNVSGYFLVIEHGLVAHAAKNNFLSTAMAETRELDQAIQTAVDYAGENALILVTNNFSLGAQPKALALKTTPHLSSEKKNRSRSKTRGKLPTLASIEMSETPFWLSGPGGPLLDEDQKVWFQSQQDLLFFVEDPEATHYPFPAACFSTQAVPTTEPAWLATQGIGSETFSGFHENTDVFSLLVEAFY